MACATSNTHPRMLRCRVWWNASLNLLLIASSAHCCMNWLGSLSDVESETAEPAGGFDEDGFDSNRVRQDCRHRPANIGLEHYKVSS